MEYKNNQKITFGLSMRLHKKEHASGNTELYNVLSEDWFHFIEKSFPSSSCLALPNNHTMLKNILTEHTLDILILTGGDDWGVFPQRDEIELELLKFAEKKKIPVLGVCRGMQVINQYFGGTIQRLSHAHISIRHSLFVDTVSQMPIPREVNSYHANGIEVDNLASSLYALAQAEDGSIEACQHKQKHIYGIMWHPEREVVPQKEDILFIESIVLKNK